MLFVSRSTPLRLAISEFPSTEVACWISANPYQKLLGFLLYADSVSYLALRRYQKLFLAVCYGLS